MQNYRGRRTACTDFTHEHYFPNKYLVFFLRHWLYPTKKVLKRFQMFQVFSHIVQIINNFMLTKDQSGKHWVVNKRSDCCIILILVRVQLLWFKKRSMARLLIITLLDLVLDLFPSLFSFIVRLLSHDGTIVFTLYINKHCQWFKICILYFHVFSTVDYMKAYNELFWTTVRHVE